MNQRKEINSLAENINNSNCNESDSELEDNSCKENYYSIKEKSKVRQRQENSLGELTKNFINYIKEQNTKEIDINEVVKKLKVKKRRIYDITNVLEGIGYIKKKGKNKIEWLYDELYSQSTTEDEEELKMFQQELDLLNYEEVRVNQSLIEARRMFEQMTENEEFDKLGYVTFEDIKSLTNGSEVNLIAIKAPPNTSLDIPDPEQIDTLHNEVRKNIEDKMQEYDEGLLDSLSKKYQLFLDSPNGEINVFLVLNNNEDNAKDEFSDPINSPLSDNDLNYRSILEPDSEKRKLGSPNENIKDASYQVSKSEDDVEMEIEEEEISSNTNNGY